MSRDERYPTPVDLIIHVPSISGLPFSSLVHGEDGSVANLLRALADCLDQDRETALEPGLVYGAGAYLTDHPAPLPIGIIARPMSSRVISETQRWIKTHLAGDADAEPDRAAHDSTHPIIRIARRLGSGGPGVPPDSIIQFNEEAP